MELKEIYHCVANVKLYVRNINTGNKIIENITDIGVETDVE